MAWAHPNLQQLQPISLLQQINVSNLYLDHPDECVSRFDNSSTPRGKSKEELKLERRNYLIDALALRRTAEDSDVTIVCEEAELFAHKCVLEASSPYFAAMFKSGMREANSGRVVFKEWKLETTSAVLDFMYTGAVDNVETYQQLIEMLAASDLLQLQDLFQFCCDTLGGMLKEENFFDIFEISCRYDTPKLQKKLLQFWKCNSTHLFLLVHFINLGAEELKALFCFLKSNRVCMDEALGNLIRWIRHNLEIREKFTEKLFDCLDDELVSLTCVQTMLKDKELMNFSHEVSVRLQKLAVQVLVSDGFKGSSQTRTCNPYANPYLHLFQ